MVVNLWFSTCAPCARELADFAAVHGELGDRVRFVGVNPLDSTAVMGRFASAIAASPTSCSATPVARLGDALDVVAYPVTLFVDADGTIAATSGPIDADELRRRIAELWP